MRRKRKPKIASVKLRLDKDVAAFLAEVGRHAGVDTSTVATVVLCMYVARVKRETARKA